MHDRGESGAGSRLAGEARAAFGAEFRALARGGPPASLRAFAREHRPGLGLFLAALAFVYYAWLGSSVAAGRYLDAYNLAFDFDPSRYVLLWTGERGEWDADANGPEYQVRHPFLLAVRPLLRALAGTGIDAKLLCTLFVGLFGAGGVLCAYLLLRVHGVALAESVLLTVLFAGSTTQIVHSIVAESYGIAAFTLAVLFLLARLRVGRPAERGRGRFLWAVTTFGVTSTNLVPTLLAEACLWVPERGWWRGALRTLAFASLLGVTLLTLAWGGGALTLDGETFEPVRILRHVLYAGTFDGDLPPEGLPAIARTFVLFAFVAPRLVEFVYPSGPPMLDFRAFDYPAWILPCVLVWGALCFVGLATSLARRETRWFGLALALGLAFQFALYTRYQYRQCMFIGTSLAHFMVFALQAEPARRLSQAPRSLRIAGLLLLALATVAIVANNHLRILEFVRHFAL